MKAPTQRDIALFFRQLSTLISAGIPIIQCCDISLTTQSNSVLRDIILAIKNNLLSGKSLHSSLASHLIYFDSLTCHLIQLGEQTGKLDSLLNTIAEHHEKRLLFSSRFKQALLYPCIVLCTATVVTLTMIIFIIPRFEELFQQQQATLPVLTQSIFFVSSLVRHHGWLGLIIFPMLYFYFAWDTEAGTKPALPRFLKKISFIYSFLLKIEHARVARQLALCLNAGLPILDALRYCSMTHEITHLTYSLQQIAKLLQSGTSLHCAMQQTQAFPELIHHLTSIGEASGTLDTMLNKAADILDTEANAQIERAGKLAEPLIMLVLGVVIGGLVIGMYLPIFNLGNAF